MAKVTILRDDLDGSEASETIRFAYRGEAYELDLSKKNAEDFDKAMQKYIAAARAPEGSTPTPPRQTRTRRSTKAPSGLDLKEVRAWAAANGHTVNAKGRIPAPVIQAFEAAQEVPTP